MLPEQCDSGPPERHEGQVRQVREGQSFVITVHGEPVAELRPTDTSVLLLLAFGEPTAAAMADRLSGFDRVHASDLLEAELRSACRRDDTNVPLEAIGNLGIVHPSRRLSSEISRVLDAGDVCGAGCWHLATALYPAPDPAELTFVMRDARQRDVAKALGFAV